MTIIDPIIINLISFVGGRSFVLRSFRCPLLNKIDMHAIRIDAIFKI